MLIHGTKVKEKNFGTVDVMECSKCAKLGEMDLVEYKKFFTLFFIPAVAYKTKYFLFCENCKKYSYEISGDEIKCAKEKVKLHKDLKAGVIAKIQFDYEISKVNTKYSGELFDRWECPQCHSGNPNGSFRCAKCGYKVV